MATERKKTKKQQQGSPARQNRMLLIFVSAFVGAVLIFGIVLGIVSGVKKSKTVASFQGIGIDYEVASFFASQYKYGFMNMLSASGHKNVEDSPGFWNKDSGNGKTYGELLNEGLRDYIAQILVTNRLYDKYSGLTKSDKDLISTAIQETLIYKADGSKEKFNTAVSEYGFSYSSYKDAVTMMYKAMFAQRVFCGDSGENLVGEREIAEDYLSEYTHVKLLFIRTETAYELDSEGNKVVNNDGTYAIRELTDAEKLERAELIADIRAHIERVGTGNYEMSPEMFDALLSENNEGDRNSHDYGYYFHKSSDFAKAFEEAYADVVNTAYEMKLDSFSEAEVDFGICFIYKYKVSYDDLEISSLADCFTDFYSDLSDVFFSEQVSALTDDVKFDKKFYGIDMIMLPYNYIYTPVF